jgi:nickel/cobalt transporter (NiCoT) family protein
MPPIPSPVRRLPGRDWRELAVLVAAVGALTAAGWTLLAAVVAPRHLDVDGQVFGVGLGLTAYTLGMRHAFDADHIAAIDNTTRRLLTQGRRPVSVGFWFALGHSTVVVLLAAATAVGARFVADLTHGGSVARHDLGLVSSGVSGRFLWLIGILNVVALAGIARAYRRSRSGPVEAAAVDLLLDRRGVLNRLLRPCPAFRAAPRAGLPRSGCCSASASTPRST